jgi:hypothetical protein
MEERIRQLNDEYGFNLSEDEIRSIARQAEESERFFAPLFAVDLADVMPILQVSRKTVKK